MTTYTPQTTSDVRHLQRINRDLAVRNTKLVELLKASRDKLALLNEQMLHLGQPPSTFGRVVARCEDPSTVDIHTSGRRMRVMVAPQVEAGTLFPGVLVRLGESSAVVEVVGEHDIGSVARICEILADRRAVISTGQGETQVIALADTLVGENSANAGDSIVYDPRAQIALAVIEHAEVAGLALEEVPDVTYKDIGGLDEQIEQIHDAVELPFAHPDLYRRFNLKPPKGVLLYGPPGCGKTLIAKAVAHSLSKRLGDNSKSYFINVKGPELLNKYVGETERTIRLIFERARELASEGRPVIVFFDEMESIFRTRGTGRSSDMETTIVPQLLTELDGVESMANVIVIGATNREELIDPAILRPGRLDVKIKVSRPTREQAADIFTRYVTSALPLKDCRDTLIEAAVDELFAPRPYVELTLSDGSVDTLEVKDFVSGAMIANIVDRAKKIAIKEQLRRCEASTCTSTPLGPGSPLTLQPAMGLRTSHMRQAVLAEMKENKDLPNTSHPEEWARITGRHGLRVVEARVVLQ